MHLKRFTWRSRDGNSRRMIRDGLLGEHFHCYHIQERFGLGNENKYTLNWNQMQIKNYYLFLPQNLW